MSTNSFNDRGEFAPFSHLVCDPLELYDSDRPFAYFAPFTYDRIRIHVDAPLEMPRGTTARGRSTEEVGAHTWNVPVTTSSLCETLPCDGIYVLGARMTNLETSGIATRSKLRVAIRGRDGDLLPFRVPQVRTCPADSSAALSACAPVTEHFVLTSLCAPDGVISVNRDLRTPLALARADARLTGYALMRASTAVDMSVSLKREEGTYIDTSTLRKSHVPTSSPPVHPHPTRTSVARSTPTDWYSYVAQNFGSDAPRFAGVSAPAQGTHNWWAALETKADHALRLASTTSDRPIAPPLIDVRTPGEIALYLTIAGEVIPRAPTRTSMISAVGTEPPVEPRRMSFVLELFVAAFPRAL